MVHYIKNYNRISRIAFGDRIKASAQACVLILSPKAGW
jgi:hypothetical protein